VGGIQFQRLELEDEVQFGHLLEVVRPLEVFNQQAVELVVGHQEVHQQQFGLILEAGLSWEFPPRTVLPGDLLPKTLYFVDGRPQSKNAVVL
jgi:hypothetical protein